MQEYRVELETFPGLMRTGDQLDRLHQAVESAGAGFLNTSLVALNEETDAVTMQLWIDAPTPLVAHGTAANIIDRSLNAVGIHIPASLVYRMECEVTDMMPGSLCWPTLEEEPIRQLSNLSRSTEEV